MSCPRCQAGKALRRVQDTPPHDIDPDNWATGYALGMLEVIAYGEGGLCDRHTPAREVRS